MRYAFWEVAELEPHRHRRTRVHSADRPTRVVVDGHLFDVAVRRGQYDVAWISGPNAGYGFSLSSSDDRSMTQTQLEEAIRNFLGQVDPETGHVE
jgi:hypothetical protein